MNEYDDPETSYRRGYVQGAHVVIETVSKYLPPDKVAGLNEFLEEALGWRLANMRGESVRQENKVTDDIVPPVRRLSEL